MSDRPSPPLLDRVVTAEEAGQRVDALLARWLDEPRARVQRRLAADEVTVDGAAAAKSHAVAAGARIVVAAPPPPPTPAPPAPVPVRWQDAHLAVVAKPAGLVTHPGAGVAESTLVDALRAQGVALAPAEDPDRPGIAHRLDRGTSGLLVVASTPEALTGLQRLLARRRVHRRYWALVDGVPREATATIDAPIARHPRKRVLFTTAAHGRPAVSRYEVVADLGRAAELSVRLGTGRTHQVRVHLSAVGHPVCGDRVYGASPLGGELGLDRPALHAAELAFEHPVTGEHVAITEPLPPDLLHARAVLTQGGPATP